MELFMKWTFKMVFLALALASCIDQVDEMDATGTFEAIETIISSQANGQIEEFLLQKGQVLDIGQFIGYVDSTQLHLQKKELEAQVNLLLTKRPSIATQLAVLEEQLVQAKREEIRITNLWKGEAATQKQLDDARSQVGIIEDKIKAQTSTLSITTKSLIEETKILQIKILQLNDKLKKCEILNPVAGTVLMTYAEPKENIVEGRPLYKIANLNILILKAFVSGDQLPQLKLNQEVKVKIDQAEGSSKEYKGVIGAIGDKAEFTPKTIQTKDERANLVYPVEIRVKNDGHLKIGMYGEVKFTGWEQSK